MTRPYSKPIIKNSSPFGAAGYMDKAPAGLRRFAHRLYNKPKVVEHEYR